MAPTAVRAQAIWVTEHYWPGLTDELVLAQAERLSRLPECRTTVVLPGQQTAFGFFDAATDDDVRRALARVGVAAAAVTPGWHLAHPTDSRGTVP